MTNHEDDSLLAVGICFLLITIIVLAGTLARLMGFI